MKTKTLTIFILTAILVLAFANLASSAVYEVNRIYDKQTRNQLTQVSVIGFICDNEDCSVNRRLWANTLSTGNDNTIVLEYPTYLMSSYGYKIYFFKPGYVPYKVSTNWYGEGRTQDYNIYLEKITASASAQINDFELSRTSINKGQTIQITAEILSPRTNPDNIQFIPAELLNNYYKDDVKVTLKVNGNTIDTENLDMLWDTEQEIDFSFTPSSAGIYNIQLITEITDNKFTNAEIETEQATLTVSETSVVIEDTTAPEITIISPEEGKTYNQILRYFHFRVYDSSPVTCQYSSDNGITKTSVTCNSGLAILNSEQGTNTWTLYATDSYGNTAQKSVTFRIDLHNGDIDDNDQKDAENNGYKKLYSEDDLEEQRYLNQFNTQSTTRTYLADEKITEQEQGKISYSLWISIILIFLIICLIILSLIIKVR
jgi:hypothetical protein